MSGPWACKTCAQPYATQRLADSCHAADQAELRAASLEREAEEARLRATTLRALHRLAGLSTQRMAERPGRRRPRSGDR